MLTVTMLTCRCLISILFSMLISLISMLTFANEVCFKVYGSVFCLQVFFSRTLTNEGKPLSAHNTALLCSLPVLRLCFTLTCQRMDTVVHLASLMAEGKSLGHSHFSDITNTGDMPDMCLCFEH